MLVPIIEEQLVNHLIAHETVKLYLKDFPLEIDTLILGCTHYPLIKKIIKKHIKENVQILDSSTIIAKHVKLFLQKSSFLNSNKNKQNIQFYVSDDSRKFYNTVKIIMGKLDVLIKEISLE